MRPGRPCRSTADPPRYSRLRRNRARPRSTHATSWSRIWRGVAPKARCMRTRAAVHGGRRLPAHAAALLAPPPLPPPQQQCASQRGAVLPACSTPAAEPPARGAPRVQLDAARSRHLKSAGAGASGSAGRGAAALPRLLACLRVGSSACAAAFAGWRQPSAGLRALQHHLARPQPCMCAYRSGRCASTTPALQRSACNG